MESTAKEPVKRKKLSLGYQCLICGVIGIALGLIFQEKVAFLKLFGDIVLHLLQMPVVLVIFCIVVEAVGNVNPKVLGRLGTKTILGFAATTAVAAIVGIAMAYLFQPGVALAEQGAALLGDTSAYTIPEGQSLANQILAFLSTNIFASLSSGSTLQVVICAVIFGIALSAYGNKHEKNPVLDGIKSLNKVLMVLVGGLVKLIPISVLAYFAFAIGQMGIAVLGTLVMIAVAYFVGVVVMVAIFLSITCLYCRVSPLRFFKHCQKTLIIGLSTGSSAPTMPYKVMEGEENMGVSPLVNRLVGPLGTNLNTDGAVLCFGLYSIVMCQIFSIEVTLPMLINMVATCTLMSFGAIMFPGGAFILYGMIMTALGLPIEGLSIIAPIDTVIARPRAMINNMDDLMIAMMIGKSEGEFDRDIYNGKRKFDPNGPISYKERLQKQQSTVNAEA